MIFPKKFSFSLIWIRYKTFKVNMSSLMKKLIFSEIWYICYQDLQKVSRWCNYKTLYCPSKGSGAFCHKNNPHQLVYGESNFFGYWVLLSTLKTRLGQKNIPLYQLHVKRWVSRSTKFFIFIYFLFTGETKSILH